MNAYLGITGTPGTGKKTLAPLVAARLEIPWRSLNDPAYSSGITRGRGHVTEVDPPKLGRLVSARVEPPCLLYGHLLPYAFGRKAFSKVVVLRCDPAVLKRRLANRGYETEKIIENVEAELIGVIAADTVAAFGKVHVAEVDTSRASVSASAAAVAGLLSSTDRSEPIDWIRSYGSAARLRSLLGSRTPSA